VPVVPNALAMSSAPRHWRELLDVARRPQRRSSGPSAWPRQRRGQDGGGVFLQHRSSGHPDGFGRSATQEGILTSPGRPRAMIRPAAPAVLAEPSGRGVLAAGSIGVFLFRDVLGSSFLATAQRW